MVAWLSVIPRTHPTCLSLFKRLAPWRRSKSTLQFWTKNSLGVKDLELVLGQPKEACAGAGSGSGDARVEGEMGRWIKQQGRKLKKKGRDRLKKKKNKRWEVDLSLPKDGRREDRKRVFKVERRVELYDISYRKEFVGIWYQWPWSSD